jgi:hypothetical protein
MLVHLPEPALRRRRLGGFGRDLGVLVDPAVRKMSEDVAQLPRETFVADAQDAAVGPAAVAAFVVAELEEGDGAAGGPGYVVAPDVDRRDEPCCLGRTTPLTRP